MVSTRNILMAASALFAFVNAAPTQNSGRQSFTPGTLNNTQEFYIRMDVTSPFDSPLTQYNGWHLEAYHTGAGLADPVFVSPSNFPGTRTYLNSTQLQFDTSPYPFSANGFPADTNYARWEPITITSGYGGGNWVIGDDGELEIVNQEFDGWLVCEWFHGDNLPQLFQLISGFDGSTGAEGVGELPSSCARVNLGVEYF